MTDNITSSQNTFSDFIRIIKSDPELRTILLVTLSFEPQYRKQQLDGLLFNPKFNMPPEELEQIFTYLMDDIFAKEVMQYLEVT